MIHLLYKEVMRAINAHLKYEPVGDVIVGKHNCADDIVAIIKDVVDHVKTPIASKETLLAAMEGILSNEQLQEALQHYTPLEKLLKAHTDIDQKYQLVWTDVHYKLCDLQQFWRARSNSDKDLKGTELKNRIKFDITGKSL